jgi:hypothetical protein
MKCSSFTIIFSESHPNSMDGPKKKKSSIEHPIKKTFFVGSLKLIWTNHKGKWTSQFGTVALAMELTTWKGGLGNVEFSTWEGGLGNMDLTM